MIVADQLVEVKWASSTRNYYINKGYDFTSNGEIFYIDIKDLPKGSKSLVEANCDFCNTEFKRIYINLNKSKLHFCNNQCMYAYRRKNGSHNNTREDYNCDMCGCNIKVKQYVLKERIDGKRKNIFCSNKCNGEWQRNYNIGESNKNFNSIKKECEYCKTEYLVPNYRKEKSKYCSHKCRQESSKNGEYIKCSNCEKDVYKNPTDIKKNKGGILFCSHKCSNEHKIKIHREFRVCEICSNKFEAKISSSQKMCSIECQGAWQSINLVGEGANNYSKEISLIDRIVNCDWCDQEHEVRSPYALRQKIEKGKSLFCSKECYREWYSKVWSQSEEWKEESRIRAVAMLEQGMFGLESEIQILTNELLDSLEISYENEYNCKYVAIDNYLSDYNLMIEVMGEFWHGDPRKYKEINYQNQVDRVKQDKIKNKYIKSQYGINILYLWESDIKNKPQLIEELIKKYIKSNGKLDDYHSFNYSFENDKLVLNDETVISYMDYDIQKFKPLINITESKRRNMKQLDRWHVISCDNCSNDFERLISKTRESHNFCCKKCFDVFKSGKVLQLQ